METEAGITVFWNRFLALEGKLRDQLADLSCDTGAAKVQSLLDDISGTLEKDICLEAGASDDGALELVISADGLSDNIPLVTAVTRSAPTVPGWKFVAFRPRIPSGSIRLRMAFGEIAPEDVSFIAFQPDDPHDADKVNVLLVATGLHEKISEQQLSTLLFLLLDMMIGEYFVMTRLAGIEFTTEPPDDADLVGALTPLTDLPDLVDSLGSDSLH